jgi:ATP-dependent DNA helicase RecG
MTLRLAPSPWRTDTFRRLHNRLENVVGAKTAKPFETLKIWTVGDLMRHLPRRYFSGTELSDLSLLQGRRGGHGPRRGRGRQGLLLHDRSARKPRLEATVTDRRGY